MIAAQYLALAAAACIALNVQVRYSETQPPEAPLQALS